MVRTKLIHGLDLPSKIFRLVLGGYCKDTMISLNEQKPPLYLNALRVASRALVKTLTGVKAVHLVLGFIDTDKECEHTHVYGGCNVIDWLVPVPCAACRYGSIASSGLHQSGSPKRTTRPDLCARQLRAMSFHRQGQPKPTCDRATVPDIAQQISCGAITRESG